MTHIALTTWQKRNNAPRMQQWMFNNAALYTNGIGNGLIALTWTIWRCLRMYAGLLVNGFDDEFACREARSNKHWGWNVPSMLVSIVQRFRYPLFDVVRIFDSDTNDSRIFWFKRNHEKGREDLNRKASQVPGNCYKKDRRWQSSWVGFWCLLLVCPWS